MQNSASTTHPFIKLSQNENPFGPSPKALEAIRTFAPDAFRYPDLFHSDLKQKLADIYKVTPGQIVLGAGSVELIDLCIKALSKPGEAVVTADATFEGYRLLAINNDRSLRLTPLKSFGIDLQAIKKQCGTDTALVFIANPNNPTGVMISHNDFVGFLSDIRRETFVVSDEAYIEYVTDEAFPKSLELLGDFPNLVIFRTFSKIYGLAGLRLGFALTSEATAERIQRRRTPFSVSVLAAKAGLAALDDKEYVLRCISVNVEERKFLYRELCSLGYAAVEPKGNFIFIDFPTPDEKNRLFEYLKARNILIRPLDQFGIKTGLRITIGRPEDNRRLLEVLKEYSY